MGHTCRTRPPRGSASAGRITRDADAVAAFLEDAAHYPGGHAPGIAYPRSEADVAGILRTADRVLPVGAQSSLTGGATPFGEVLLSTARMNQVLASSADAITVQSGVTLDAVQAALEPFGAAYPPIPTFTGASAGGSVSTNAAGAATFKYGSTRNWVEGLKVVLANGEVLELTRGQCRASESGFRIVCTGSVLDVPVPGYTMPGVQKISAGYFARPGMDLVDLFIGSEGTLGVLTDVTLRALSPAPETALALIFCQSEQAGLALAAELRRVASETWRTRDPDGVDVRAIEYMDDRSLTLLAAHGDLAERHVTVPAASALALLVQLELPAEITPEAAYLQIESALLPDVRDTALVRFCRLLDRFGLLDATELAAPGDAQRQNQLLQFRESLPARVNQLVGAAKRTVDPRIEKTAADMIVPFECFAAMMDVYRRGFASRGLPYAIWGHLSDGNVHPNVIPRTFDDVRLGKEAILEFGREIARLGGCPLAEHGVGRNPVKQALLRQLYGDAGIEQMRAVKRALDPNWKLAPGVMFPR